MKNRIETEIDKTLGCFDTNVNVQISPLFAEKLNSRIADTRVSGRVGYRSTVFYPVVIVLLVVMNFAIGWSCFIEHRQDRASAEIDQASVLASEYGIGQGFDFNI